MHPLIPCAAPKLRAVLLLAAVGLLALLSSTRQASAATVVDDFDDNSINTVTWNVITSGGFSSVAETNQRAEFTHDEARGSLGSGFAGLIGNCKLRGDFDIQVDFELLDWPSQNGGRLSLVGSPLFWMERLSADNEYYLASLGAGSVLIPTSDMTGKLRLQRTGDTATASYFDGDWVVASTRTGASTADVTFNITSGVDSGDNPATIVASADNAQLNAGTLGCYRNGDLDCNGSASRFDALDAVLAAAGHPPVWVGCPAIGSSLTQPSSASGPSVFGDVDCNGVADVRDLLPILRFVADLPTRLPTSCTPVGELIQIAS